ncbi:MAG: hypothetical protein A3I68_02020 [Candidatus Melainabacteria bacterium RIFCSPLOWO2_02_FULL_35_15]|nr:MAG: hypothetical protein A3F80_01730 [Candidatus Melainabacteria bacterium RIFCSPLOWO2_12_FULL_35_11]OGI13841.1 MAG: hypothetical protein A3I68_02020 [Candidatus Melainabacteria bacterium RIFCSPLOWO2_02_FULL_35_15]
MWCVPKLTKEFKSRMEAILKLYKKPYDKNNLVICLDEKPYQLLGDTRKSTLPKPGKIAKQDYEYKRNGTCCIFLAIEPKAGKRFTFVRKRRTRIDFAMVVKRILEYYPSAKKFRFVVDNLNTHNEKSLIKAFGEKEAKEMMKRIEFYFTPKHASWLNMAETEISVLSRQCLSQRMSSLKLARIKISSWQRRRNRLKIRINWTFSKKDAKNVFPKLYNTGN